VQKIVGKKTRRPTKPRGLKPVIAVRVPESIHKRIHAAAKTSGRSMSEEMAWRLARTFERQPPNVIAVPSGHYIHADGKISPVPEAPDPNARARKLISGEAQVGDTPKPAIGDAHVQELFTNAEVENVRRAMRAVGFTQIPDYLGGYWAEPGMSVAPLKESLVRELKAIIKEALAEKDQS
jgi:hypothetical protein